MKRLEDSLHIEKQETYLQQDVAPKVEKYVKEQFGTVRYTYVTYDMEVGKHLVVLTFEEINKDMTQVEFDAFVEFLKETVGLGHATVIVDYSLREVVFKTAF